jgi:inner membrane protein involved in colicin E2 resistance
VIETLERSMNKSETKNEESKKDPQLNSNVNASFISNYSQLSLNEEQKALSKFQTDENQEEINVSWWCYWKLITMSHGYLLILLSLPFYTVYMYAGIISNYKVAEWMGHRETGFSTYFFIIIFWSLVVAIGISLAYLCIVFAILHVSRKLH